jgi:hypothetical protein
MRKITEDGAVPGVVGLECEDWLAYGRLVNTAVRYGVSYEMLINFIERLSAAAKGADE